MTNPRSLQEWVHWLEVGPGARWIRAAALLTGVMLLSILAGYKQFRGPLSETTFAQTVVARQLAEGNGFTTPVRYPQTLAVLTARGAGPRMDRAWPELHRPPLYTLAVAGVLAVLPRDVRDALFQRPPVPPGGFGPDYLLLGLNLALLWLAAWLTYSLGRRLFDATVGAIAALGLLASVSIWGQTIAVNGTPLMMVVLLGLFHALVRTEQAAATGKPARGWLLGAGAACGLLFLGDHAAGFALLPAVVYLSFRYSGKPRAIALAAVLLGFLVLVTPWVWRNVAWTGNPFGLAGQDVALTAGDPTADPAVVRATLSAAAPALDLKKFANKGLTGIQVALRDRLWSGGGMLFTALFVVGLLYRFRAGTTNRLRWIFVATLAVLVGAHAFLDSGEGERLPAVYAAPLIAVFGAGFFAVLVASSEALARQLRWAGTALVVLQALPLVHDLAEPRRLHFSYPPYFPGLFIGVREQMALRGNAAWMADVPAGAAWYSGERVWAQPATLRDFYALGADQPVSALVLTPHTLDRPFFSDLARLGANPNRLGEWAQVYSGLVTNRFPPGFPLVFSQKVSDDLHVLLDPFVLQSRGK